MQIYTDFETNQYISEIKKRDPQFNFAQLFKRAVKLEAITDTSLDMLSEEKIRLLKDLQQGESSNLEIRKKLNIIEAKEQEKRQELIDRREREESEVKQILLEWYNLSDPYLVKKILDEYFGSEDNMKRRRMFLEEQASKYHLVYVPMKERKKVLA